MSLAGRQILLIIGGGIAAYKTLDLARRLRERGATVRAVMTEAAQAFVTPLSVGAITGGKVFTSLLDRDEEHDIGHIRLARESDLVVVAPATADLLARMSHGLASTLSTVILLATQRPVLVAPAMNPAMWAHPATAANVALLKHRGIHFIGPEIGEMAERGEAGLGRMAEPLAIVAAIEGLLTGAGELAGRHVLVTAGPTHEAIDPVRYIANRSSGRQGYAIAAAAAAAGARVTLVSGPVALAPPANVTTIHVETAEAMKDAVLKALPADAAVMTAAVGDWRVASASDAKIKKLPGTPMRLDLVENTDILALVSRHPTDRPALVVGFAAETGDVAAKAIAKRETKGCDWIVGNDVSPATGIMGGAENEVVLVTASGLETWPRLAKAEVAQRLVARIATALTATSGQ